VEIEKVKDVIRALADGRDPATGEHFPPGSPYQQADTVRALFIALEALERRSRVRAERPVDPNRPKVGANWTPEEEQQLRDGFAAHKSIPELATAHGRTVGAITARLVKLGLIEDNPMNRAGQGNRPPERSDFRRPQSDAPAPAAGGSDADPLPF
jgi:hypothetical protein